MQGIGACHIDVNGAEHTLGDGEKIAVGFIHQTVIRQGIGHSKLYGNAPGFGVCHKLELIMAHRFMARPKSRKHRRDLQDAPPDAPDGFQR